MSTIGKGFKIVGDKVRPTRRRHPQQHGESAMTEITPSEDATPERIVVTEEREVFVALWLFNREWRAVGGLCDTADQAMDVAVDGGHVGRVIKVTLPYPVEDEA